MILSQKNTLTQDITEAKKQGFILEFYYRDFKIYARNTDKVYDKNDCLLIEYCRHEGMSDPGDASILFLIACNDGSKGHLISGYGIYADSEVIDFVLSLKKQTK
ncbi:hypothetical protein [Cellulophaga sp. Hel_I_12]|uniref:hypothetical protein n=1 Tax=Cellulophaga sp. Hel_I_12 TaxID=1249972 RepID=UPI0006476057|nr:hypothetical protein [Cellulophaga sp. Hel_I_12]